MNLANSIDAFSIVAFAALIHASFQLSVSALTLMSGHAIGKKTAHARLLRLAGSFLLGAVVMTMLLLSATAYIVGSLANGTAPVVAWTISCGILFALGVSVWIFYYRRVERGTALWLPRSVALYLRERSKRTANSGEAFGLGLTSVIAEVLFLLGPILVSALVLIHLSPDLQLIGVALYTVISILPLAVITLLIGSGHGLGSIQKWRESNKRFLQFASGSALIILGMYIYVQHVLTVAVATGGNI